MAEVTMFQSCGLPFNKEHSHFITIEPDGSRCIYCTNCYKDGEFVDPELSMEEMTVLLPPLNPGSNNKLHKI